MPWAIHRYARYCSLVLHGWVAEAVAIGLLAAVLTAAMLGRALLEASVAVLAAVLVLGLGLITPTVAGQRTEELAPTLGFLAAILVLAHLADAEGVFGWLGEQLAAASKGSARRLLVLVFAAAAGTTAVLSLDATVVLLTPVVLVTTRRLRVAARPQLYACAHLANSASLLLPVSNLTNLLAFGASGLGFLGFTGLMALPWLAVLAVEFLVLSMAFRADLRGAVSESVAQQARTTPWFALIVLGAVLVGFAVGSPLGIAPAWIALGGVLVLLARRPRNVSVELVRAASPGFLIFVLGLSVVVAAVAGNGLGDALGQLLPTTDGLLGLLAMAGIAAVLANLVNNLPATLVLLSALGPHPGAGLVLAMLLGVNIGPNLSYLGSLATVLWRRVLSARGVTTRLGEFTAVGMVSAPVGLAIAVLALWCGLTLSQG